MSLRGGRWALFLVLCLAWALPAQAQDMTPDVVLGRADADASGGWPVALWVVDGDRSSFIVSAPREMLGDLPGVRWTAVDVEALMSLERFGAPRLRAQVDRGWCPSTLTWGDTMRWHEPPSAHWPGERADLRHGACAAGGCAARQAWRVELPTGSGERLPLGLLMPGLASQAPDWLVLHVVSRYGWPGVAEVRYLAVAPGLDGGALLPLAAAARFPEIDTALLLRAARGQGSEEKSVLMRADAIGEAERVPYIRNWDGSLAQRQALGLQAAPASAGSITRLLLRLHPADRPAALTLMARDSRMPSNFGPLRAVMPEPATAAACRAQLAMLRCEPACAQRITEIRKNPAPDLVTGRRSERPSPAACRRSCELQKRQAEQGLAASDRDAEAREQRGWAWVAAQTGRPAVDWLSSR